MDKPQVEGLKAFWSDIRNVENATAENIQSDVLAYLETVEQLQQQNTAMLEALAWYGTQENYEFNVTDQWQPITPIDEDAGRRARSLLSTIEGGKAT